jgi:AraC-like DNA-binding protein
MESSFISRSSRIAADPLSDVLSLLNLRGYMSGGIDAGRDWSLQFERDPYFRCFAIVSGLCWLSVEGVEGAVCLREGDFVVLPHGRAFRLGSDLAVAPVDIMTVITAPLNGNVFCWQGGGACLALGALFTFTGDDADILLGVLPPLVHIRKDANRSTMRWYLERMMKVIREPQPGGILLGEHLAQMMLIEVLGLHLADSAPGGVGWLSALADKQIGAAITAMHENPGHRWTLQGLAARVGMSRSAFARRFKEKVGTSVMKYLTRWRMRRAGHRLANSSDSVASIAASLSYESESAFCFAFKREMGYSPRQYGHARVSDPAALATIDANL